MDLKESGFKNVVGVEINDGTHFLMKTSLAEISGHAYLNNKIVRAEGRAYLETGKEKCDTILFKNTDLYALNLQNNIFLESYLYIEEALQKYIEHLRPEGVLFLIRNLREGATRNSTDSIRLLQTTYDFMLKKM